MEPSPSQQKWQTRKRPEQVLQDYTVSGIIVKDHISSIKRMSQPFGKLKCVQRVKTTD